MEPNVPCVSRGMVMGGRRAAYIGLRILSLYFGIRGIEVMVSTFAFRFVENSFGGAERWVHLAAATVPVLAAVVLWAAAEPLAARLGAVLPMTAGEIEAAFDGDEGETEGQRDDDEDHSDADARPERDGRFVETLFLAALMTLGAYFVVRGLEGTAAGSAQLALHNQKCGLLRPGVRFSQPCHFWDAAAISNAINLSANLILLGLGALLLVSPDALFNAPQRLRHWTRWTFARVPPED